MPMAPAVAGTLLGCCFSSRVLLRQPGGSAFVRRERPTRLFGLKML
jgi:hypothetical protein